MSLQIASLNSGSNGNCYYIGNSNEDAYYSKNAGVEFIYLERKEHEFDLKDYAITTIQTLEDLFNI